MSSSSNWHLPSGLTDDPREEERRLLAGRADSPERIPDSPRTPPARRPNLPQRQNDSLGQGPASGDSVWMSPMSDYRSVVMMASGMTALELENSPFRYSLVEEEERERYRQQEMQRQLRENIAAATRIAQGRVADVYGNSRPPLFNQFGQNPPMQMRQNLRAMSMGSSGNGSVQIPTGPRGTGVGVSPPFEGRQPPTMPFSTPMGNNISPATGIARGRVVSTGSGQGIPPGPPSFAHGRLASTGSLQLNVQRGSFLSSGRHPHPGNPPVLNTTGLNPPRGPMADINVNTTAIVPRVNPVTLPVPQPIPQPRPLPPPQPIANPTTALVNFNSPPSVPPTAGHPKPALAPPKPEDLNSSVWITNIPLGTTEPILLDLLTGAANFGKIFSCEIIHGGGGNRHPNSAAAIAFFTRASAKHLLTYILNRQFKIQGTTLNDAYWNKKIVIPPLLKSACSRVLIIQGPKKVVNINDLEEYLDTKKPGLSFETARVDTVGNIIDGPKDHRSLIWTFASYVGQAESVMIILREEFGDQGVRVIFGVDPIEVGPVAAWKANFGVASRVLQVWS